MLHPPPTLTPKARSPDAWWTAPARFCRARRSSCRPRNWPASTDAQGEFYLHRSRARQLQSPGFLRRVRSFENGRHGGGGRNQHVESTWKSPRRTSRSWSPRSGRAARPKSINRTRTADNILQVLPGGGHYLPAERQCGRRAGPAAFRHAGADRRRRRIRPGARHRAAPDQRHHRRHHAFLRPSRPCARSGWT